jgi:integrase
MSRQTQQLLVDPAPRAGPMQITTRSLWSDAVWHLDGVRPARKPSEYALHWGFRLPDDSCFTDPQWVNWLEAAKSFLWSLKVDPPAGRFAAHETTVARTFKNLRMLIRWMAGRGHRRFADLHREAATDFMTEMSRRPGNNGKTLSSGTLDGYQNLLWLLYMQGSRMPEVAIEEPLRPLQRGNRPARGWLPYTPDEIAVPLVSAALRLIAAPADEIIALFVQAQSAYDEALGRGRSQTRAGFDVIPAIADVSFSTLPGETMPWQAAPVKSTKQVRQLVDRLYEACFITIAYLIGARISEILGLQLGCIEQHPSADGTEQFAYLVGRIYKTSRNRDGDPHRWVAAAPVVRAIAVMEQLSAPLRRRSGRNDLWLVLDSTGLIGPAATIGLPHGHTIISRLNHSFATYVGLPPYRGKPWHLTPHQGRKTFARFVGKRDRSGLHALQMHFGHVTRVMTDRGYVGTDFVLDELIDRHAREETRHALEELLTATTLGGKAGRTIAQRSRFRGRTRDGAVQAYVEFLMQETDLRLGVCDWGYCVYRQETSACAGDEKGPNPLLRTQSICASCSNFAVTEKHRPVWEARRARNLELLGQPSLDGESRKLAQQRIAECEGVLAQLIDAAEVSTDGA